MADDMVMQGVNGISSNGIYLDVISDTNEVRI